MFFARGFVPDIRRREFIRKYCPISGEQEVYWIIWSLQIISFDIIHVARNTSPQCNEY